MDVCETKTGFRQTEYKGGAGKGGVWLNGRFLWLTGYARRSANDWAGLGGAYPDWMHDFTLALLRESNGNYVRWMHVSPSGPTPRPATGWASSRSARRATRNGR